MTFAYFYHRLSTKFYCKRKFMAGKFITTFFHNLWNNKSTLELMISKLLQYNQIYSDLRIT